MSDLPPNSAGIASSAVLAPGSPGYLLALWTTDPGSGATAASGEVTGGSYARQAIQFGAPSAGVIASTNSQSFTNMPGVVVTHIAIFDVTGATYLWGGSLTGGNLTVPAGSLVNFNVGSVTAVSS